MFICSLVLDLLHHGADLLAQNRRSTGHGSSRSSVVHHHHVKLRSSTYILLGSQSFTIQAPFSDIAEGLTLVNLLYSCVFSCFHRSSVINPYEARKIAAAAALVLPNTGSGVIPSTLISPVKALHRVHLISGEDKSAGRNSLVDIVATPYQDVGWKWADSKPVVWASLCTLCWIYWPNMCMGFP
ncbi:unnamed protein product [Arabis nemorensis]|uniref:Uncharacterized protein n=1 Tax=Arabis nemorensis TaxID=586526 RepID=A0A565C754_9BRAS|nr:unnamed protein product [Arabis nemorensis]